MLVKAQSDLDDLRDEQMQQRSILEEHQRRSLANEKSVEILSQAVQPIQNHVLLVNFTVKIVSIIAATVLLLATVWQAIK